MSDFDGYGFAVGTLRGLRSFAVDDLGRLTGVSVKSVWRPGDNTASCKAVGQVYGGGNFFISGSIIGGGSMPYGMPSSPTAAKVAAKALGEEVEHDPGTCSCGFYAYYADENNPYHDADETVAAVVEAWGKVTQGPKGFRAQKARIVALCIPTATKKKTPLRRRITNSLWLNAPLWGITIPPAVLGLLSNDPLRSSLGAVALILTAAAMGAFFYNRTKAISSAPLTPYARAVLGGSPISTVELRQRLERVRRNYPDVPVFSNRADMYRAFPPDASPLAEMSPETAEDFWTRPVAS